MKPHGIPICNHPATVVLIDDDRHFLQQYVELIREVTPCIAFSDPQEALDFLAQHQVHSFLHRCADQAYGKTDAETHLSLDETKIHQDIYNADRFADITVIVCDYLMPVMNGAEVFEQIAQLDIQKILLTGEADETIAVQAFNQNIIDTYIKKDTPNLAGTLLDMIQTLQTQYFLNLSNSVEKLLANKEYDALGKCFADDAFVPVFQQLLRQHHIVEYYFVSGPGNLLLLDAKGTPSWLLIKDEKEMDDMIDFAIDQYDEEPLESLQPLFDQIKAKKRILFRYNDADFEAPTEQWEPLLHPCEKVVCGKSTYYYALITDNHHYDINSDKIISLTHYMATQFPTS